MSQIETVTLKLKPGSSTGSGWNNTTASNGQPYAFKYSGGHDDTGGLETKVGDGQATINLSVDTDNRYSIFGVNFVSDTAIVSPSRRFTCNITCTSELPSPM